MNGAARIRALKAGFEKNLENGAVYRENHFIGVFKNMVIDGFCELPSIYFMDTGKIRIDKKECVSILKGYGRMLKTYPNYHLAIIEQLDENQQSLRHIKCNRHITINPWKNSQPVLIYSDQMIMVHEFQTYLIIYGCNYPWGPAKVS